MTYSLIRPDSADIALPLRRGDLHLREPHVNDAPRMAEYLSDFEVAGNLANVPVPYYVANAKAWLNALPERTDMTSFAVTHAQHGFVGMVDFQHADGEANVSYWLGRPYWNKGMMTEALIAALNWYFTITRADRVLSGIFHFNMASLAIQQKLGFVETDRSVAHCLARGQDVEHIDTELTRDAFDVIEDSRKETNGLRTRLIF